MDCSLVVQGARLSELGLRFAEDTMKHADSTWSLFYHKPRQARKKWNKPMFGLVKIYTTIQIPPMQMDMLPRLTRQSNPVYPMGGASASGLGVRLDRVRTIDVDSGGDQAPAAK